MSHEKWDACSGRESMSRTGGCQTALLLKCLEIIGLVPQLDARVTDDDGASIALSLSLFIRSLVGASLRMAVTMSEDQN
jgi:hypothetical protein